MASTTYHLWRQFLVAPYYRWACEVIQDDEAPDGYRVLGSDPIVADTAFFHRLAKALTGPVDVMVMSQDGDKRVHSRERQEVRSPDHFENAIRRVEGAVLGQSPKHYEKVKAK